MSTTWSRALVPVLIALTSTSCERRSGETWGFVATLGTDTTSVERLTRQGDHIVSEAVGRSPVVVRRRWEATLAPDGTLRHWSMDTHVANAPPAEADLHHEVDLGKGTIRLVRRTGSGTSDRSYGQAYAHTVPWNAFVYGTFELLFQAARGVPDSARIGQYFFEGWDEGHIGYAHVRRLPDGRLGIRSTGEGAARLDEQGHMLSYSGEGTTYKQEVRRVEDVPDIDAVYERFAAAERAQGVARELSPRDTMRAAIGQASLLVDYSRPLLRGRVLLGGLIPYDQVWRTGANAATQLTLGSPLKLAGVPLERGSYTLWTLPSRTQVQLIINGQTGQWGTEYGSSEDIARVAMHVDTLASPVERFTIRVDTTRSLLVMEWGTFRWTAPIQLAR